MGASNSTLLEPEQTTVINQMGRVQALSSLIIVLCMYVLCMYVIYTLCFEQDLNILTIALLAACSDPKVKHDSGCKAHEKCELITYWRKSSRFIDCQWPGQRYLCVINNTCVGICLTGCV